MIGTWGLLIRQKKNARGDARAFLCLLPEKA